MRLFSSGPPHVPRWHGCVSPYCATRGRGTAGEEGVADRFPIFSFLTREPRRQGSIPRRAPRPWVYRGSRFRDGVALGRRAPGPIARTRNRLGTRTVDVIVTTGSPATFAAKQATHIPIVFASAGSVVQRGIVASLARPGGNVTGLQQQLNVPKLIQLLKETVPTVTRVA